MSYTFGTPVETTNSGANAVSITVTGVPANGVIAVMYTFNNGGGETLVSISDSVGGALTTVGSLVNSSSISCYGAYITGLTAGSHTITGTASSYGGNYLGGLWIGGANVFDAGKTADINFPGTGADACKFASGFTTTTSGDCVIMLLSVLSGTPAISAGTTPNVFTSLGFANSAGDFFSFGEQFTQSASGLINPTATLSSNSDVFGFGAAFTPATAATVNPLMYTRKNVLYFI